LAASATVSTARADDGASGAAALSLPAPDASDAPVDGTALSELLLPPPLPPAASAAVDWAALSCSSLPLHPTTSNPTTIGAAHQTLRLFVMPDRRSPVPLRFPWSHRESPPAAVPALALPLGLRPLRARRGREAVNEGRVWRRPASPAGPQPAQVHGERSGDGDDDAPQHDLPHLVVLLVRDATAGGAVAAGSGASGPIGGAPPGV
jgi:hypothetical protein